MPATTKSIRPKPKSSRQSSVKKDDPEINGHFLWHELSGRNSKYKWMYKVLENIHEHTNGAITRDVIKYLEISLENFADNFLNDIPFSAQSSENFGTEIVNSWFGLDDDETVTSTQVFAEIAEIIQKSYEEEEKTLDEDMSDRSGFFIGITTKLVLKFLDESVMNMSESVNFVEELTLYFLLYTCKYDIRFLVFYIDDMMDDRFIPKSINVDGFTVSILRTELAEYIRANLETVPRIEEGVMEIIAGSSSLIDEGMTKTKCIKDCKFGNGYRTGNSFIKRHAVIIEKIIRKIASLADGIDSDAWTNAMALDSFSSVADDI
jgi:hypothetical protein